MNRDGRTSVTRAWAISALAWLALGCNAIAGIEPPVAPSSDANVAREGGGGAGGTSVDGNADGGAHSGGATGDAHDAEVEGPPRRVPCNADAGVTHGPWPDWPMPNPGSELPNPQSYDVEADGVVRDNVTGLLWQRASDATKRTYDEAIAYCASFTLAGCDNWRLPTRIELVSLVDFTRSLPAIDPVFLTLDDIFWSSSVYVPMAGRAWDVRFQDGETTVDRTIAHSLARCVAGSIALTTGSSAPADRYAIDADTVLDKTTEFLWQRSPDAIDRTWSAADGYCRTLRLHDTDGWRLPSMKELQTIVDEAFLDAAIDPVVFPNTRSGGYWTSSLYAPASSGISAWQIESQGKAFPLDQTSTAAVRCVR